MIDHNRHYTIEDVVWNLQNAAESIQRREMRERDRYHEVATQIIGALAHQTPDHCINCGRFTYLNQNRCCSSRCLNQRESRQRGGHV